MESNLYFSISKLISIISKYPFNVNHPLISFKVLAAIPFVASSKRVYIEWSFKLVIRKLSLTLKRLSSLPTQVIQTLVSHSGVSSLDLQLLQKQFFSLLTSPLSGCLMFWIVLQFIWAHDGSIQSFYHSSLSRLPFFILA